MEEEDSNKTNGKRKLSETASQQNCKFFVKRKKRFCKMTVAKNKEFCGEHLAMMDTETGEMPTDYRRIPCPLDAKHTVFINKLHKHLQICNARPPQDQPKFIEKNVNSGSGDDEVVDEPKLSEVPALELSRIVSKIEEIHATYIAGTIKEQRFAHDSLANEISNTTKGGQAEKHLTQTSAILGCLQHAGLLSDETCYVEFGAGKGQLAYFLAQSIASFPASTTLLIDRASLRHKMDNKLGDTGLVSRVRADIADLNMSRMDIPVNCRRRIAVSKHLCGAATDLTLRCIVSGNQNAAIRTEGILIAVCCHHRCDWRSFVGKSFLIENGVTRSDFTKIIKMVSWAICGTGTSRKHRKEQSAQLTPYLGTENSKWSREEKEEIGIKCKRVLDFARLRFLEENQFTAILTTYVDRSVTLENVCLMAKLNL